VITTYFPDGVTVRSLKELPTEYKIGVSLQFSENGSLETAKSTYLKTTVLNQATFFLSVALAVQSDELLIIDFTVVNNRFQQVYQQFLAEKIKKENELLTKKRITGINKSEQNKAPKQFTKLTNHLLAPQVVKPKVALGLKFLPNGRNKLYTQTGDIWMDGDFKKGQLMDGKVFLYDSDGVLLKVRIYKNGAYERDGLL
jgi:antitoxin component YwqK of YwqJK toxin-antitoxin module